jgi:membrane-anchored glycerophosphoryl diester phosphodiesterase (GDPDase)
MRTKFWRTKYLTGSKVQMRYLGLLLFSMIVPLVFVGGCLYYLIFNVMAEQIGIPEYVAYNLFPVVNKINLILILGVPPLFALLIWWGIILSHRFAGPVERLESELKRMSECGDYSCRIKMRKHDDMRPIADAINRLLERLDGKKG